MAGEVRVDDTAIGAAKVRHLAERVPERERLLGLKARRPTRCRSHAQAWWSRQHARRAGRDLSILNAGDAELLAHIQLLVAARPAHSPRPPWTKGAIYEVLANRVHLGETGH